MLNIAIDGHVASGKSTIAKEIAKRLGLKVLDTGAIYRGLACAFKDSGLQQPNEENIAKFVQTINVEVAFVEDKQHVVVNSIDYTPFLRLEETSRLSSLISPYPVLREKVMTIQRKFAEENNCVMEGRDIGTDVLPNAQVKLFVTAKDEVRAKRRYDQLNDKSVSFEQILADLRERDYKDEHREVAPLRKAKDSIVIDSSEITLEETIQTCIDIINLKLQE